MINTLFELHIDDTIKFVNAAAVFNDLYKGVKNCMTPNIIKYGKINDTLAYELSSGKFMNKTMYGITVISVMIDGFHQPNHDLSKAFQSLRDATEYVKELQEQLK